MKLFENRSLKRLGFYLLTGMFLIFFVEYFVIRYKIEVLEEVEEKKDYARGAQLSAQQIALLLHQFEDGQQTLATDIAARLDEQDHLLEVLRDGGRIDGTTIFLKPLSRLPRLTFDEVQKVWTRYKQNILNIVLEDPAQLDSAAAVRYAQSQKLLPAQWTTLSGWYKRLEADLSEEADLKKNSVERWVFSFILFDIVLLASLYLVFYRYLLRPIGQLEEHVRNHHQEADLKPNEIGSLTGQVNVILEELKDASEFVAAIGAGNLDFDYRSLDRDYVQGKNKLADSLIAMQEKLKALSVEEQRRQWANEGLSKFVDILRAAHDNITALGDRIISTLVQYTGSNQGGLYILNDDDEHNKYLELVSLFAFNIKKFEKQKVRLGEGILGQTFLEKQTTVLSDIPEEYVRITSGLGDANPKSLLVVPLKVDQHVYGMVELASFKAYAPHEIEFVERLAETIASTLASVKAAQKNTVLIAQFRQQTEEMQSQEEEMRQNMEELQATQEELSRKEQDYISRIRELEGRSAGAEETEKVRSDFLAREKAYRERIAELELKLAHAPKRADDWQLAEEVERNLRTQLEAMRLTQDALSQK